MYAFAKEFGWTPEITTSLPLNQVIILLNCMTEEADELKKAQNPEEAQSEEDSMKFVPKNKHAKNLSDMPIDKLHATLKSEFGTTEGGGA